MAAVRDHFVGLAPAPGVLLVTYGSDGTPTCTNQVMDINAHLADFASAGVTVLGLSKDSVAKHDKFVAKMGDRLCRCCPTRRAM